MNEFLGTSKLDRYRLRNFLKLYLPVMHIDSEPVTKFVQTIKF